MYKLKLAYYRLLERILPFIGKDAMRFKIEKYRLRGAIIGESVRAFSPITSAEPYLLTVGDNVTIATGVKFITHDNSAIKIYENATDFVGSITIGNNVFIGACSILLPGITIADNCIIGAGSIVCRSCSTPGTVLAGNPAKPIGTVEKMQEKYKDYIFDFRNKKRKSEILNNPNRWIKR